MYVLILCFIWMAAKKNLFRASIYNAQSLNTCTDDFISAVERYSPDVLAINESWLREGCEALAPVIPSYNFRMRPRPRGVRDGRGGGVAFYIRQGLTARALKHPPSVVEQFWLRITVNGLRLAIGTAYRPPWQNVDVFLDSVAESIVSFAYLDKIILLGDFNINLLDHGTNCVRKFNSFLQSTGLEQMVSEPTHFTENTATLLDVVCTDCRVRTFRVL